MTSHRILLRPTVVARTLAVVVVALVALHHAGQYFRVHAPEGVIANSIFPKFDLDGEQSIPAFFSSILLLFASAALLAIASAPRTTAFRLHWWVLAGIFAFLSLDEAVGFHEMLTTPVRGVLDLPDWLSFAWVLPVAVLVLLFAAAYLRFLQGLPPRYRALFTLAGVLYVGGAMGIEVLGAATRGTGAYQATMTVEEVAEMAGVIVFLYALLSYKGEHTGDTVIEIDRTAR